eukprot:1157327-Pelagomonas_calceolata.AAC.2
MSVRAFEYPQPNRKKTVGETAGEKRRFGKNDFLCREKETALIDKLEADMTLPSRWGRYDT